MFTWSFIFLLSEWIIRVAMVPVVIRRQSPTSAMAWLMVIFFIPWLGLFVYFLVGQHRLPMRRIDRHARLLAEIRSMVERFRRHPNIVEPEVHADARPAVALAERLGYMPILGGNDCQVMTVTDEVIDRLIADIDAAAGHVHLLFYIFAPDETGERVAAALVRAAQRGVKCRVLVDAVGSRPMLRVLAPRMVAAGVEVHGALAVGLFRRSFARFDLRNHRKIAVIDGRIGYTGSQNIVNANYGHRDLAWHDMMLRLTGPIVLELQTVFFMDWYFDTGMLLEIEATFPDPELTGNVAAQALPSGPSFPVGGYQRIVVAAIYAARRSVVITTPYFVPDEPLLQSLQVASYRGVDVQLIVPFRSDHPLVQAASRAYFDDLLEAGVRVHLFTDGLLHSKTMTVDDDLALVGSSNFDIRSFSLNFEISVLLYGEKTTAELRARQARYLRRCIRLDAETWSRRSLPVRLAQQTAKLLSPLL